MIVSKGFDLVDLALAVVRPKNCLLLHDREMAAEAEELERQINGRRRESECRAYRGEFCAESRDELVGELRSLIARFFNDVPSDRLVIDLTGGQRVMNLALYDAAPPGSYVVCYQTKLARETRRPEPFSEKLHRWQVVRGE